MTPLPYEDSRFLPGAMIAERYRIVGMLGRGGMGEVYRADDLRLGQPVALKFLPESIAGDARRRELLFGEARVALKVTHPNVCRVYDIGEVDGHLYLSMEYIDGEDLASLLRRIGRLPADKAVEIARQVCSGLAAAHDEGILHRDLKPANVMLDGRGRARITDFGLAGLESAFEGGEIRAGTPAYMSPEQFEGTEVTVKSDIYALGLVLYELFTGKQAFSGETAMEIARKKTTTLPTSPSSHISNIDAAVESVILRCLEGDPARRPESAPAVAAALPGGDPLAAALAAGDTPSPELVAAAGEQEAMSPVVALVVALVSIGVFWGASTLTARHDLRAYVAPQKTPEVLKDRAKEVVRSLGYTEAIYSDPADSAVGYSTWYHHLDYIEENDDSPDRWQQLANARPGAVSFWYRQSPIFYLPRSTPFIGIRPVSRWDPFPQFTGEILVNLDVQGRLTLFAATPKRFDSEAVEGEPDWSLLFELADLDMAQFTRVTPRYQRFMAPEHRAAWVGYLPQTPDLELRIEAGWHQGRPVLFGLLWPWEIEGLSADPVRRTGLGSQATVNSIVLLSLIAFAMVLARRNLKRDRADRNGARRLTVAVFTIAVASQLLLAPAGMYGNPLLPFFLLGPALFLAALVGAAYVALEPYARRIWPTMLTSWSRLVGGEGLRWRDPSLGRSILWGLAGGAAMSLLFPLTDLVERLAQGGTIRPSIGSWRVLLGQRMVLAEIVNGLLEGGAATACRVTLMLILFRFIFRRRVPAMILMVLVMGLLGAFQAKYSSVPVGFAVETIQMIVTVTILVRFGFLALMVASFVFPTLTRMASTADWSAWYAHPSWTALAVVVALAVYGYWSATAGRRLIPEEP